MNLNVMMDISQIVLIPIVAQKVGLVMVYVMVWINHGAVISPVMIVMGVTVMQLLVLHAKMMAW
jgi:hypothetical protein